MRAFRDAPIRTKLMLIVLTVVGSAMLASTLALTLHDFAITKPAAAAQLTRLADIVGSNSTVALNFKRPDGAEDALKSLSLDPAVVLAAIYDVDGSVFALYRTDSSKEWPPPAMGSEGYSFHEEGDVEIFKRIRQEDQIIGTVYLRARMDRFYAPLWFRVLRRLIVMAGALALAVFLGWRLHRTVSGPVSRLLRATQTISTQADYSVRVPKDANDELGMLCDSFNAMLIQIQARDAELERHQLHLEKLVQERTATLEAKTEELARSNAELELFASVASHDLQEPLRMVSSYVELLAQRYREQLDDKGRRWVGFAVDGAGRMKQLINDLLEYSRVGTRGKPLEPTDCETVLTQVTTNLQRAIADKGAVVTAGPLPTVTADPTQLSQLLQNLVGNAIKFCSTTQPEVRVEAVRDDDAWHFSVRDNGIGIDPQFAERIFVIFQRLHTREQYSGTGIGLAVCKKIVERHGGSIWVESQLGQGAVFHFTIPDRKGLAHGSEQTGATG